MSEKKQLNEEELKSVNGGAGGNGEFFVCNKCQKEFEINTAERRKNGSGCDYHYEYKCPYCDTWN